jgi:hypothetical protein
MNPEKRGARQGTPEIKLHRKHNPRVRKASIQIFPSGLRTINASLVKVGRPDGSGE